MPGSDLLILRMVIPSLIGNPSDESVNSYFWVDDHLLTQGKNGRLDPSRYASYSYNTYIYIYACIYMYYIVLSFVIYIYICI